jgi:hypothetical protein
LSSEARVYVQVRPAAPPGGGERKIVSISNGFQKEEKMESIKLVIV